MPGTPHERLVLRAQEARKRGLQRAKQATAERAALKRQVARGEVAFLDMIEGTAGRDVESVFKSGRLGPMMRAIPDVGPVTVDEICGELGIKPETHVSELTHAQRKLISETIEAVLKGRGLL